MQSEQVRANFHLAVTGRTLAMALMLGLGASVAGAQGALSSGSSAAQTPAHAAGNVVSGRVTENSVLPLAGAPGWAPSPAGGTPVTATPPTEGGSSGLPTETAHPTPPPVAPDSTVLDAEQANLTTQAMDLVAPILSHPVESASFLLALMLVLAVLTYRRHHRVNVQAPSLNSIGHDPLEDLQKSPSAAPWLSPQGLQAEIMALDLELGPSEAPVPNPVATTPTTTPPLKGHDLNLHKLQWSEQLLAAGEYELARVLLTSVAQSLHHQLTPTEATLQGPSQ